MFNFQHVKTNIKKESKNLSINNLALKSDFNIRFQKKYPIFIQLYCQIRLINKLIYLKKYI